MNAGDGCQDIDFDRDLEGWLGKKGAIVAVPGEAGQWPTTFAVLQVTDQGQARTGLEKLGECLGGGGEDDGIAFVDSFAIIGQDQAGVDAIAADARAGSLADSTSYTSLVGKAGGEGILTGYVAPSAPSIIGEAFEHEFSNFDAPMDPSDEVSSAPLQPASTVRPGQARSGFPTDLPTDPVPPIGLGSPFGGFFDTFDHFNGAALSVRFEDSGVTAEAVGDGMPDAFLAGAGSSGIEDLPAATLFAAGAPAGTDALGGLFGTFFGFGMFSAADGMGDFLAEQLKESTGLTVDQFNTLFAGGFVVAARSDLDASWFESGDDTSPQPVGVRIQGDPVRLRPLLDRFADAARRDGGPQIFIVVGDGVIAFALDQGYAAELVQDGSLGEEDSFQKVLSRAGDSSGTAFFNAPTHDWSDTDAQTAANLAALGPVGVESWKDGTVSHIALRLTSR